MRQHFFSYFAAWSAVIDMTEQCFFFPLPFGHPEQNEICSAKTTLHYIASSLVLFTQVNSPSSFFCNFLCGFTLFQRDELTK